MRSDQREPAAVSGKCTYRGSEAMSYGGEQPYHSGSASPVRGDLQERLLIRLNYDRAHPIFAPLAWVACLLFGAAFWLTVFRWLF